MDDLDIAKLPKSHADYLCEVADTFGVDGLTVAVMRLRASGTAYSKIADCARAAGRRVSASRMRQLALSGTGEAVRFAQGAGDGVGDVAAARITAGVCEILAQRGSLAPRARGVLVTRGGDRG